MRGIPDVGGRCTPVVGCRDGRWDRARTCSSGASPRVTPKAEWATRPFPGAPTGIAEQAVERNWRSAEERLQTGIEVGGERGSR